MALFHKDVYMPKFPLPNGIFELTYSNHAKRERDKDRYGQIQLPSHLNTSEATVIEVELTQIGVSKIVYRMLHDKDNDIILVIIPQKMFVKTVWLNSKYDKHDTLNRKQYVGG